MCRKAVARSRIQSRQTRAARGRLGSTKSLSTASCAGSSVVKGPMMSRM